MTFDLLLPYGHPSSLLSPIFGLLVPVRWTQLCLGTCLSSGKILHEVLLFDTMFAAAFSSLGKWISEVVCKYVTTKVVVTCNFF